MELNLIDSSLKSDFTNSKKSNNRDWEKSFWQQQNMQTIALNSESQTSNLVKQTLIKQHDSSDTVKFNDDIIKDLQPVKLSTMPSAMYKKPSMNEYLAVNKEIQVYQDNSKRMEIKDAIRSQRNSYTPSLSKQSIEADATKTSMIHKNNKDIKIWTSKESEIEGWKAKLTSIFSYFGLNLVELTVRGKKY